MFYLMVLRSGKKKWNTVGNSEWKRNIYVKILVIFLSFPVQLYKFNVNFPPYPSRPSGSINMQQKVTCNLFSVASFSKLELFTTFERFLVSCPSSRASCKRKRRLPTANLRNASPRTSSLSREKCSLHFSVVSASRTWTSVSEYQSSIRG